MESLGGVEGLVGQRNQMTTGSYSWLLDAVIPDLQ